MELAANEFRSSVTDIELIARVVAGDATAERELYETYGILLRQPSSVRLKRLEAFGASRHSRPGCIRSESRWRSTAFERQSG